MTTTADGLDLAKRLRATSYLHHRGPNYEPLPVPPSALALEAAAFIERSCNTGQGVGEVEAVLDAEEAALISYRDEHCQGHDVVKRHAHTVADARLSEVRVIRRKLAAALAARIPEASVEQAATPVKSALRAYAEASKSERCPICSSVEGCDHTVRERLLADLGVEQAGRSSAVAWRWRYGEDFDWSFSPEINLEYAKEAGLETQPLYLAPPAGRQEARWPIETDDEVEVLARECGINNRRYMTPKDYSIWCEQQRKFARLARLSPSGADLGGEVERLRAALEIAKSEELRIHGEKVDHLNARLEAESRLATAAKALSGAQERFAQIDCATIGQMTNTTPLELLDWCKAIAGCGFDETTKALSSITPAAGEDATDA